MADYNVNIAVRGDASGATHAFGQVDQSMRQISTGAGQLGTVIKGAFAAFAASQAIQTIGDLRALGDEMADTRVMFEAVGGNASVMDGMRQAALGAIDDLSLLTGAVKLLRLEVADTSTLDEWSRRITLLKPATQDFATAADGLAESLARGRITSLAEWGLSPDEIKARADALEAMGMAAGDALRQATGEAMDEQIERLGPALEDQYDAWDRINAKILTIKQNLGVMLADTLMPVIEALDKLLGVGMTYAPGAPGRVSAETAGGYLAAQYGQATGLQIDPYRWQTAAGAMAQNRALGLDRESILNLSSIGGLLISRPEMEYLYDNFDAALVRATADVAALAEGAGWWEREMTQAATATGAVADALTGPQTDYLGRAGGFLGRLNSIMFGPDTGSPIAPMPRQYFSGDEAAQARLWADTVAATREQMELAAKASEGMFSEQDLANMKAYATEAERMARAVEAGAAAFEGMSLSTALGTDAANPLLSQGTDALLGALRESGMGDTEIEAIARELNLVSGRETELSLLFDEALPMWADVFKEYGTKVGTERFTAFLEGLRLAEAGMGPMPMTLTDMMGLGGIGLSGGGRKTLDGEGKAPWDFSLLPEQSPLDIFGQLPMGTMDESGKAEKEGLAAMVREAEAMKQAIDDVANISVPALDEAFIRPIEKTAIIRSNLAGIQAATWRVNLMPVVNEASATALTQMLLPYIIAGLEQRGFKPVVSPTVPSRVPAGTPVMTRD